MEAAKISGDFGANFPDRRVHVWAQAAIDDVFCFFPRFTLVGTKNSGRSHDPWPRPGGAPAPGEAEKGPNTATHRKKHGHR